jgi:hypothetical protein
MRERILFPSLSDPNPLRHYKPPSNPSTAPHCHWTTYNFTPFNMDKFRLHQSWQLRAMSNVDLSSSTISYYLQLVWFCG